MVSVENFEKYSTVFFHTFDQNGQVKMIQVKTIGEKIRELREARGLLLRQIAAELEVDPSLLSKIERGDKRPTRDQVVHLSKIFKMNEDELLVIYLSDRVVYELKDEQLALKAMQVAEKKISYLIKEKNGKA
ncbi:MAG: helix-turn-helix transcriptional regulator [bacterium]|nr:helix-turn-helix transcriptional regulator [bacterium]